MTDILVSLEGASKPSDVSLRLQEPSSTRSAGSERLELIPYFARPV